MKEEFTWIPFYKEMAQKLLQFKNNRLPLVNWIYKSLDNSYLSHFKDNIKGKRMTDVDPYTVFALFNRGISKNKRIDICTLFKNYLNIKAPVPQDFVGIPVMTALKSNFIAFEDKRKNGDINRLWDLFEASVNSKDIKVPYDALKGQYLIKRNITMGLFWTRPDRFLPLDGNSRAFLNTLGIKVANNFIPYDDYNDIMKKLNTKMKNENLGYNDYPSFSAAAYMAKDNEDNTIDDDGIRYWMYSPGEYARMWDDCVSNGIMCLGWDELGDLTNYKNREKMRKKMIALYGSSSSYKNDSLATWQFANDMQEGDVVFAKKGLTHIVGRGIVESDYVYDASRDEYVHTRKVKWTNTGDWKTEWKQAMKTLTDVTTYSDYVDKLNKMIDADERLAHSVAEPQLTGYRQYWWLVADPKIWSVTDWKLGSYQSYSLYNKDGNKRRIFKHFLDAKAGDVVVCYEGTPIQKVTALASISKESDGNLLWFKKEKEIERTISLSDIRGNSLLSKMEFMKNPTGSLFKLSQEEYDTILRLSQQVDNRYAKDDFLKEVFVSESDYEKLTTLLLRKKNLILQGAPGVGKTFAAKRLAYAIMGEKDNDHIMSVQFHQNYSYEDFVMGYKPNGNGGFDLRTGKFYDFCDKARKDINHKYFFIIDEINRGNLSKIFGELLMLIENTHRNEEIELSYNKEKFSVPDNLFLIGLMNTADRSLAIIDYALRRRFSFFDMKPGFKSPAFSKEIKEKKDSKLDNLVQAIINLNEVIEKDDSLGSDFCIGHSYLCNLGTDYDLESIVEYDIIPMLKEYWFDNPEKYKIEAEKLKKAL